MCEIAVKNVRKSSFLCYKLIFNIKSFLINLNSMTTDYKDEVFKLVKSIFTVSKSIFKTSFRKLVVKFHRFQDNF